MSKQYEIDRARNQVLRQLKGRIRGFTIVSHRDGVVLHGVAPSYYVKQLAQHSAGTALTCPIQRNDIEVRYSCEQSVSRV